MNAPSHPRRRAANLTLDAALLDEAKALGVNVSRACERGLAEQLAEVRAARWISENAPAIAASNAYVEGNGLPLAAHRLF